MVAALSTDSQRSSQQQGSNLFLRFRKATAFDDCFCLWIVDFQMCRGAEMSTDSDISTSDLIMSTLFSDVKSE
jgi:hypothetical protein